MLAVWILFTLWLASVEFIFDFSEIYSTVGSHFVFKFLVYTLVLLPNCLLFVLLHTDFVGLRILGFRLGLFFGFCFWISSICVVPVDSQTRLGNTTSVVVTIIPISNMATTKEDDAISVLSDTSKNVKKVCDTCKKMLAAGDPHTSCCTCLGQDHDMLSCQFCQQLPHAQQLMRARRLAHWYEKGLDACPSMNAITKILTTGSIPEYLLVENITPYFKPGKQQVEGDDGDDDGDFDEDVDDEGDNGGHNSEQECGDIMLHGTDEAKELKVVEKVISPVKTLTKKPVFKIPKVKKVSHTQVKPQGVAQTMDVSQLMMAMEERQKEREEKLFDRFLSIVNASKSSTKQSQSHNAPVFPLQHNIPEKKGDSETQFGLFDEEDGSEGEADVVPQKSSDVCSKLPMGATNYDWDFAGAREAFEVTPGTPLNTLIGSVEKASELIGEYLCLPRSDIESSRDFTMGFYDDIVPEQSSHVCFPIPDSLRNVWENSRKSTNVVTGPLVPTVVRKTYKLPAEDWSHLGAVRRADFILQKTCHTKLSPKGVHYLNYPDSSKFCASMDKVVQATAHTFRTNVVMSHSATAGLDMLSQLKSYMSPDTDPEVAKLVQGIETSLKLSGTAALHNADCVSRVNAFALRSLRHEWLYRSTLDKDMKERVKKSPLCDGTVSSSGDVEFVAPIVGSILQTELDHEYEVNKKSEALKRKTNAVKRPSSGNQQQSFKRGRGAQNRRGRGSNNNSNSNRPYVQPGTPRGGPAFRARGRGRGGRGGRGGTRRPNQQPKQQA